ncbi:MAG: O-antigen ligase family protein [Candidatus Eisenbacteria bacterium]|uniref:O-antigen ligase family protein n=1 Tax=Eiseniibacteriota bacterium TaxID=2212470 RepID=A0A938BQN0_UNCEI|nr:O-antigen ligase family protein [Candidatus Eisenbacteria bacterium]
MSSTRSEPGASDGRVAVDPAVAGRFRHGPPVPRDAARDAALGRRILLFAAVILSSAAAGAALVRFPPHLAIGVVGALVAGAAVLVRPFWGLLLYTAIFLVRPAELYPPLAALHLERLVGGLTLAAMLLAQYQREGRILIDRSRQTTLLLVFLLAVLLSVPFAYWRAGALNGFFEMVKLAIFYVLIVHLIDTRRKLRAFIWVFGLLTVYISATAFVDFQRGGAFFAQGIERAVGETSVANNPNQLGTTMAVAVPFFLLLALYRPFGGWRLFFVLGAPLLLATMAVTGSRASLLGFLGGTLYLWWTSRRRILLGALGLLLLVAGFAALPEQYRARYSTIAQEQLDGSSQARLATWMTGVKMVIDRPVFGVGVRCFGTARAADYSSPERRNWLESHSLYLQVLAELGLVGGILFYLLLFEFLRLNRRAARLVAGGGERWRFEALLLKALFAGFVVLMIAGIFGHSLLRHTWYVYAALGACVQRLRQGEIDAAAPAGK